METPPSPLMLPYRMVSIGGGVWEIIDNTSNEVISGGTPRKMIQEMLDQMNTPAPDRGE